MRTQLSNEVVDVINDFGPKLYEDFNEVSIVLVYHEASTYSKFEYRHECCPPQAYPPLVENLAYGEEQVVLVLSMLKVWVSFIP